MEYSVDETLHEQQETADERMRRNQAYIARMIAGDDEKAAHALGVEVEYLAASVDGMSKEEREIAWSGARDILTDRFLQKIFDGITVLPEKLPEAKFSDVVSMIKVFTEKVILLQGEPTTRSETTHLEDVFARALDELNAKAERAAKRRVDALVPIPEIPETTPDE